MNSCLLSERRRLETGSLGGVKAMAIVVHYQLSLTANLSDLADDITRGQRQAYCWPLGGVLSLYIKI